MKIHFDNKQQADRAIALSIGRILLLGSRPERQGDIKQYEDAKYVAMCAAEFLGVDMADNSSHFHRDYHKIHRD